MNIKLKYQHEIRKLMDIIRDKKNDEHSRTKVLPGKGCKYIITHRKIGEGSFSKVYRGYIQEPVAIKKINLSRIKNHKSNLEEEIKIMASLKHKNIVNLLDTVRHDGQIYLIMEYCEDGDLKKYLRRQPMKEKHVRYYLKQLMEGLKYLKTRNIIHRDLKPQNLLLSNDKKVLKISDFGFAKALSSEESLAETMCGTPYYMAPEIMHNKKYQSKADLWSVGIIMYEMSFGMYPYGENITGPYELRDKIDSIVIRYPSEIKVSQDGLDLLGGLLEKDPGLRISWEEFFIHSWFYPRLKPKNIRNKPVMASSAPVRTDTLFEMEDSTTNIQAISPLPCNSTFSTAPFLESQSPRKNSSFLNLVENYRSTNFDEETTCFNNNNNMQQKSEPILIRHPQYEENSNDEIHNSSVWSQNLRGYWNASVRLAKDSFRSFHSLP
jgi:serine/threonine protein kinase